MDDSTILAQMQNQIFLVFLNILDDKSSVFKIKFLLVEMSLDEAYSVPDFDVSLVIEHKIGHCLVRVEVYLSIGRQSQPAVFNFDLLYCFQT